LGGIEIAVRCTWLLIWGAYRGFGAGGLAFDLGGSIEIAVRCTWLLIGSL